MHERTFPESAEEPTAVTRRALDALEYEERAKLGFRRRGVLGTNDPYFEPERYNIDRETTTTEIVGAYFAAAGLVFGLIAFVFKPLLMATAAVVLCMIGIGAGREAAHVARWGIGIACFGFFFGMIFSILTDRAVF